MMRRLAILVLAGMAAIAAGGCVPATYVEVPAIRGRVVNPDGQPAGDAIVHVVRDSDQVELATVSTQHDGTFARPQQGELWLQIAGADRASCTYSVGATTGARRSPTTQVSDGVRRWFFGYYDPPLDRDLGDLSVR